MAISPLAGKPAPKELLVDLRRLEQEYYERRPDLGDRNQLVRFGTSGHRGSPLRGSFTEAHILAITQAICDYRRRQGTDGRLITISAADPLNLSGIVTAGDRIRAARRNHIVYRDGMPLAVMEGDFVRELSPIDPAIAADVSRALGRRAVFGTVFR